MSARDCYTWDRYFGDYACRNGERMARVRDELMREKVPVMVTFYVDGGGVWVVHHEEGPFEFAHEAFERGVEWVEERRAA